MSGPRDKADDFVFWLAELVGKLLSDHDRSLLEQHGLPVVEPVPDRDRVVGSIDQAVRDVWGGAAVYIHRAGWRNIGERDEAIRADRKRMSLSECAAKYSISRTQIRRICGETD